MSRLVVRKGWVICPTTGLDEVHDLWIEGGRITRLEKPGTSPTGDAEELDADGCLVLPGAIDVLTTLRDPGREDEEPLEVTLRAAAAGGYAAVVGEPGTSPCVDNAEVVGRLRERAALAGGAELLVSGSLSVGLAGEDLAELGEMATAGAVSFSDPRANLPDGLLRHALEYAATFGRPALLRPLSLSLAEGGVVAEGPLAARLGLDGVPEAAETLGVFRAIELCRLTGARVGVGPLSSAASVRLVTAARAEGLPVFGLVSALHLLLDERVHLERRYDTALRLSPPLRTDEDRRALVAAAQAGDLVVVSGHRPVSPRFKEVEFARAEPGAANLAISLSLLVAGQGREGVLSPSGLARAVAVGPSDLLGLADRGRLEPGTRGDLTVLDPDAPFAITPQSLRSPCPSHPLLGQRTACGVRATVVGGRVLRASAGSTGTD